MRYNNSKIFSALIITVLFVFTVYASAQALPDKGPGELSIFLGGGLSSIHHQEAPRAVVFKR